MRPPGSPRTGVPGRLHREAAGERPPRARPQRRGSPGPIPNPAVKPAFAESTAARGCGRAGRRARGGRFSNMSRTLSIDNIGPGLDSFEPGSGPFSISTLLRRPRRVSPTPVFAVEYPPVAHLCAGQSVATAGVTSSKRQSVHAGGACGARKRKDWGSPQRPRIGPQDGMDRAMS